jgi:hypothetical protein
MLAAGGKNAAADILAVQGDTDPVVVGRANRSVDATLTIDAQPHTDFSIVGGTLAMSGIYARLLAPERRIALIRHLLRIAATSPDMLVALDGIAALARHLSDRIRDEFFERVFRFSAPSVDRSRDGQRDLREYMTEGAHASVVHAAALLARTPAQAERLAPLLWTALRSDHDIRQERAASALEKMRPRPSGFDTRFLAAHNSTDVREVAVTLWSEDPARFPDLSDVFLQDSDARVRRKLVMQLRQVRRTAPDLADRLERALALDRSAAVRWTLANRPELEELATPD